jgi:hypothetical protein
VGAISPARRKNSASIGAARNLSGVSIAHDCMAPCPVADRVARKRPDARIAVTAVARLNTPGDNDARLRCWSHCHPLMTSDSGR